MLAIQQIFKPSGFLLDGFFMYYNTIQLYLSSFTTYLCSMKKIVFIFMLFGLFKTNYLHAQDVKKSIYDFSVEGLSGGKIDFSQYKGKKILIVNTASKCGLTPQYEELEKLYKLYKDQLVIIGFPANDFLFQEPGNNETIASFCQKNYGVSFPMASKISVKGKDMAPIYLWLTQKKYNGVEDTKVKWNFQKYLINEKGEYVRMFDPRTTPMDQEVVDAINRK
jgi:glutathione peroxidase